MQVGLQVTPLAYKGTALNGSHNPLRSSAGDTVKFASVRGAKTAKITFDCPKPSDAAAIEDLHTMLLMLGNPNRVYGVPIGWTQKRVSELQTIGVRQVKERIQKAQDKPEQHFWRVARNKHGEIVGFAEAYKVDDQKICLYLLFIHPDYQGSIAANKLFQETVQWGRRHAYSSMELAIAPYNPAIGFYRSQGCDIVPDSLKMFDQIMPLLSMSLDLTRSTQGRENNWESFEQKPAGFFQKLGQRFLGRPSQVRMSDFHITELPG